MSSPSYPGGGKQVEHDSSVKPPKVQEAKQRPYRSVIRRVFRGGKRK